MKMSPFKKKKKENEDTTTVLHFSVCLGSTRYVILSSSTPINLFVITFVGFSGDPTMTISPAAILLKRGEIRSTKTTLPVIFKVGSMLGPGICKNYRGIL